MAPGVKSDRSCVGKFPCSAPGGCSTVTKGASESFKPVVESCWCNAFPMTDAHGSGDSEKMSVVRTVVRGSVGFAISYGLSDPESGRSLMPREVLDSPARRYA